MGNKSNELFNYTEHNLLSLNFQVEHKTAREHFTRKSPLDFETTTRIILHLIKKSMKVELMDCFYQFDKKAEVPSRQAFSQAREKISYLTFKDFFNKSCELAVADENAGLYRGYRLFAVDGTTFVVGELSKLKEYFGESTTIDGKAMCRLSCVVEVLSECIVNSAVSPFSTGERALAIQQIEELKNVSNALYLFDRGYWSPSLVSHIIGNGQKFLMRLASNTGKTLAKDKDGNEYHLRRYTFILPSGETEVLLTNITDEEMTDEELVSLYAKRWGVETKYLELKDRLQIDKFACITANAVLQDIYSTLYISNLTAFLCLEADEVIKEKTAGKDNAFKQKANRSVCIAALRRRFIDLCLLNDPIMLSHALRKLVMDISKEVVYVNKSKSRPRDKRQIKQSRAFAFKSVL